MAIPFGLAGLTSLAVAVLNAIHDPAHRASPTAMFTTVGLFLAGAPIGAIVSGWFRHRDESYADTVAARLVGPDACIKGLRATPGGRFPSQRHPRTAQRVKLIERLRERSASTISR